MNFEEKYYNSHDEKYGEFDNKDECFYKTIEKSYCCCPVKWESKCHDKKEDEKGCGCVRAEKEDKCECKDKNNYSDRKCDKNCGCEEKYNKYDNFKPECEEKKDNRNCGCNRCNRCCFFRGFRF